MSNYLKVLPDDAKQIKNALNWIDTKETYTELKLVQLLIDIQKKFLIINIMENIFNIKHK